MDTLRYMVLTTMRPETMANMDSIRIALAIVASKQWEVHHMDVRCAFLNGDMTEYIYMPKL